MKPYELTQEQLKQYIEVLDVAETYRDLSEDEKENIVRAIMERPYMDLRSDFAFKHVFSDMNLLKMMLGDVLPEDIVSVEPLDTLTTLPNEIGKMRPDDKNIIMDVIAQTEDGRKIIVEMQRKKQTHI